MRILDCKNENCKDIVSGAPQMIDHLCEECKVHFKEVLEFLEELAIPYNLNPYLVRGLDYYTKTVFEIYQDTPEGRQQGALLAGGRYDNLIKQLGGRDVPGCGGAAGVERIINIMKIEKIRFHHSPVPKVFLAQLGTLAKRRALKLIDEFRESKVPVAESLSGDNLQAQMNIANKIKAQYVIILGQKEVLEDMAILKTMKTGKQVSIKLDKLVKIIKKRVR